jgi:hypothetical protein
VPPLLFAAIRFTVVAVPACFLVPRPPVPFRTVAAAGASLGQFAFLYLPTHLGMPPGLAALVLQAQVPITIVTAAAVLRERPAPAQVADVARARRAGARSSALCRQLPPGSCGAATATSQDPRRSQPLKPCCRCGRTNGAVMASPPGSVTAGGAAVTDLWARLLPAMPRFAPEDPLPALVSGDVALTATVAGPGAGGAAAAGRQLAAAA